MFGFKFGYGYGTRISTALAQALIDYRMDTFNVTDDVYGPELITNGTFDDGVSGWVESGSIISNGVATFNLSAYIYTLKTSYTLPANIYIITFDIVDYVSGTLKLYLDLELGLAVHGGAGWSGNGTYTILHTSSSASTLQARAGVSGFVGSIDNVSVKEIINYSGDRTVDNVGSAGSSYDGNAYSSNMIALQSTQTLDVDIAHTLGEELVTNGTFDTSTDWNLDTGWTISNGLLTAVNGGNFTTQSNVFSTIGGEVYEVTYTISDYVSGSIKILAGANYNLTSYSANGTYTEIFTNPSGGNGILYFRGGGTFTGSIDNISVKEVTNPNSFLTYYNGITKDVEVIGNSVDGGSSVEKVTNGDFSDGLNEWYVGGDAVANIVSEELVVTSTLVTDRIVRQAISCEVGKTYQLNVKVKGSSSSRVRITDSSSTSAPAAVNSSCDITPTASFVEYSSLFVATATTMYFAVLPYTDGVSTTTVDNISVKEILPISTTYTFTEGQTIQNVLPTTVQPTTQDLANLKAYPEDFYKLATGKTTKGTYSFDSGSVYAYYPCNDADSGQYVQDLSVDLGDDTFDFLNRSYYTITGRTVTINATDIDISIDNSEPTISETHFNITEQGYYVYTVEVGESTFPSNQFAIAIYNATKAQYYWNYKSDEYYLNSNTKRSVMFYKTDNNADNILFFVIRNTGTSPATGTVKIKNVELRTATAKEITNYTTSARLTNQNHGMLNHLLKRDLTGRITDVADSNLIEHDGDGRYIDTGWIPSATEDWTLEIIINVLGTAPTTGLSGLYFNAESQINIGQLSNGNIEARVGNIGTAFSATTGLHHIVIRRNNSEGKTYTTIDKINKTTVSSTYTESLSLYLGCRNREAIVDVPLISTIGKVIVHKGKLLTADEVATAYAKAKLIYPTLP